jgi:hypothetical protein
VRTWTALQTWLVAARQVRFETAVWSPSPSVTVGVRPSPTPATTTPSTAAIPNTPTHPSRCTSTATARLYRRNRSTTQNQRSTTQRRLTSLPAELDVSLPTERSQGIADKRRAAATELITKLTADGPLSIHNPDNDTITEWRRVIDFAKRNGLVPAGKRIVKNRPHGRHLKIELVDGAHPNARPDPSVAPPITVPERTDSWHPLLRGLAAKNHRLRVSPDSLDRTLRVLHALLTEAQQRGYQAAWADDHGDTVAFTTSRHRYELVLEEEYDARQVLPTTDELATGKTYSWQRVQPEWKSLPTGNPRIQLTTGYEYSGRPQTWADRQRWSLEDKLGDVLAEIEARTRLAEERARAAEEARVARRREWETAMATARLRFQEDRRAAALTEQVTAWDRTVRIRAYCDAQDKAIADNPDLADRLAQWLGWCRSYADRIDPIRHRDLEPDDVEPRREDLRPYLGRFSPYGPDER